MTRPSAVLAPHRDDGWLTLLVRPGRVAVPEVGLLVVAVALVGLAAGIAVSSGDTPGPHGAAVGSLVGAWVIAVAGRAGRGLPRLDWPIPALLRALEYGTVLVLTGGGAWTYGLLATLAFRHYDIVYRVRLSGSPPPRWLAVASGGWPLRLALLVLAMLGGVLDAAVIALTVVLAPLFVVEAARHWTRTTS